MRTYAIITALLPVALADDPLTPSEEENNRVQRYIVWTWLALVLTLLFYRATIASLQHVRKLVSMGVSSKDGRQRYYSIPNDMWATTKKHLIHAPLFRKRHNREFKLSAAINVGTLPSRLQSLFLIGYFAANAVYCGMTIDWSSKTTAYRDGVHRSGVVIAVNICALFLLAGRNNPLIYLLNITFDTYNLIHRWIGRIVVLETIAHVAFWVCGQYAQYGSKKASATIPVLIANQPLFLSGTIGTAAFVFLLLHSPSAIRHAFYEVFLHVHIAVAMLATGALWVHLNGLETQRVLLVAIVFWAVERLVRLYLLVRNNVRQGITKAHVEAMPGDAVRVTLQVARPWRFYPGQHIYLYMPSIGLWTSHPFSVVWSQEETVSEREKILPTTNIDQFAPKKTTMSLVIRRRTGFTNSLYRKAEVAQGGKLSATAFVEGPYGCQSFKSYGTVMLYAAGVGITHQVPHVRDLVQSYAEGTCATRRVILVWVIQSPEHLEWIRPWMTQILSMEKRRDVLKVLLFVSRPRSTKEIHSPSSSVQMFPGKPDVAALLQKEVDHQIGAMAVSVCGTGSMADDVRCAVRDRVQSTEIDFFEEAFSW